MQLKTIDEIRAASLSEAIEYKSNVLTQENLVFNTTEIGMILSDLRSDAAEIPASSFVVDYFIAFAREYYDEIMWSIKKSSEALLFSDENLLILVWTVNDSVTHSLILDSLQAERIELALTAIEAGIVVDDIANLTLSYLEADTERFEPHHGLLEGIALCPTTSGEIVPELSQTLSIDDSTARFSSAIWFEEIQKKVIILAGVGGIGSYVAFLLSRMHPRSLFIYDDDKVELVNMAGQLYSLQDVGRYKVDVMAQTARDYSTYNNVYAIRERFTANTVPADIMICGFDSMASRSLFFNKWVEHVATRSEEEKAHCLFIDGRLAAEEFQVLCIRGDDEYNRVRYSREFLFSDAEAEEALCSYKQTSYMANMIGSIIVNLFTNFVANELVGGLRDLPFFTSYSADSMMFKTEQ